MPQSLSEKYGSYAMITGASAGIGKAFAEELARRGMNLVLVARDPGKLELLVTELTQRFQVDVKCISLDLSQPESVDRLLSATNSLHIGLLILNAGVARVGGFLNGSAEHDVSMIGLNALVPTLLAQGIGHQMKERRRGGIVFVSSLAGIAPAPYQAVYAASKAYLTTLGLALSIEFERFGVDVSVLAPGMTETEGLRSTANIDYSRMQGGAAMSPSEVVKVCLDGLGRQSHIVPGRKNKLTALVARLLPQESAARMVAKATVAAMNPEAM